MRLTSLLSLLFIGVCTCLHGNNIQVSNISFDEDLGNDIYTVHFDISWENSWRTSTHESNYDAAWVFLKWKSTNNPDWQHGNIDQVQNIPSGSEVILPSDGVGVFVQRSADGIGDISFNDIQLAWLHNEFDADEVIEICVFAIEMVFIPEGPFEVGDGDSQGFNRNFARGGSNAPFTINDEGDLILGGTNPSNLSFIPGTGSDCFFSPTDFDLVTIQILPAAFPKGFKAFYCMKYEISQGQYAAFLNNLTPLQAEARYDPSNFELDRYSIWQRGSPGVYLANAPKRACNYLDWIDMAWYADWSGLRPMSELEFEKACRGPLSAVAGEYAWGNSSIDTEPYVIVSTETGEEQVTNTVPDLGNAISVETSPLEEGPFNCGLFSLLNHSADRVNSGASYYGVMELTGNLFETIVGTGVPEGRSFDGLTHGDGVINSLGVTSWPAIVEVDGAIIAKGSGYRGGSYVLPSSDLTVSNRCYVNTLGVFDRLRGGRLVRSNF